MGFYFLNGESFHIVSFHSKNLAAIWKNNFIITHILKIAVKAFPSSGLELALVSLLAQEEPSVCIGWGWKRFLLSFSLKMCFKRFLCEFENLGTKKYSALMNACAATPSCENCSPHVYFLCPSPLSFYTGSFETGFQTLYNLKRVIWKVQWQEWETEILHRPVESPDVCNMQDCLHWSQELSLRPK